MDDWIAAVILISFLTGFLWHYLQVYLDSLVTKEKKKDATPKT